MGLIIHILNQKNILENDIIFKEYGKIKVFFKGIGFRQGTTLLLERMSGTKMIETVSGI